MAAAIRLPLIVNEHGDLNFFGSVGDLERYVEPIDVRNNEYEVYDADGHRLRLTVIEGPRGTERVQLFTQPLRDAEGDLRRILLDYLGRSGADRVALEMEDLEGMIRRAVELAGFTR